MKGSVNLDVMIGYKAKQVSNRVAKRKVDRLRRSSNNCQRKMNGTDKKINSIKRKIEKMKKESSGIEMMEKGEKEFAKIMRKVRRFEEQMKRERSRKSNYAKRKKLAKITWDDRNHEFFGDGFPYFMLELRLAQKCDEYGIEFESVKKTEAEAIKEEKKAKAAERKAAKEAADT